MSVLVIDYNLLGNIAGYSSNIVKSADEYTATLTKIVKEPISSLDGGTSSNLENAKYFVDKKIKALQKKAEDFREFAISIANLYETAERVDQDVANMLANRQETHCYSIINHLGSRIGRLTS